MSRPSALGPLRVPAFRLLAAGRTVAVLGNAVAPVAVAFAVLDLTGSAAALGLVLAARTVPQVLLVLAGGVVADHIPRHRVLVVANTASALTQGVTAALVLAGGADVWQLVALQAVNGAAAAFSFPAAAALTPQTVPAELLQPANALLRLGLNGAMISGAALGGIVVGVAGPGWGLAVDAAAFGTGAVLFALLRVPSVTGRRSAPVLAELRAGWGEFRSRTWLWAIVAAFAVINAAAAAVSGVLGPVIADSSIGRSGWGLVLAGQALGLLLGGLLALRLRLDRPLLAGTAGCLLSVPWLLVLALAPSTAVLFPLALLAGVGMELFGVAWDVSVQENVPADMLSRVYSYDLLGSLVVVPVGQLVAGPAAVALGARAAVVVAAVTAGGAVLAALAVPSVRGLRRAAPAQAAPAQAAPAQAAPPAAPAPAVADAR